MVEQCFRIYIFITYADCICFLKDGRATDVTNEETDIEPPLIRKLTKHEIAANIFLFSKYKLLHLFF
jgi:hypothetical protein